MEQSPPTSVAALHSLKIATRKEILQSVKNVYKVIPGRYILDQKFINKNKIDIVVQGSDYKNRKFKNKVITFPRTLGISSSKMRKIAAKNALKKRSLKT